MDARMLDEILWMHLSSLPYFRGMLRAVEHSFYAEMNLERPILDMGAGDGHFASVVFAEPVEVGLDPWRKPIEEARQRGVYQLLTQANGDRIPFTDASFETVISNSVLEHIAEIDPVLQDIGRVMEPGGVFVFCVPNQRFLRDLWGQGILDRVGLHRLATHYNRFFNRVARHEHLDAPEVWIKRLENAGFKVEKYWHYFPVRAMHMLERGHLFGLPNLLWKKTTGRWVLIQKRWNPFIPWRKVRKYMNTGACEDGTCTFYIARRAA
jgi:ubiquinone/menaquinone biosynthesis C-methylase UbiE